jgi:hypothetical protein
MHMHSLETLLFFRFFKFFHKFSRGKKERKTSNLFAGLRYDLWISEQNRTGGEILVYYDTFIPLGFVKVARFS